MSSLVEVGNDPNKQENWPENEKYIGLLVKFLIISYYTYSYLSNDIAVFK